MTPLNYSSKLLFVIAALALTSCFVDDPGPLQEMERHYSIVDFDRLEMGDAFHIDVEQGNFFEVSVRGDRRNVEDLVVKTEGTTLVIRYRQHRERRHDTFVTITLPELYSINFSGASESRVHGFSDAEIFGVNLSGASVCQLDVEVGRMNAVVSGASLLNVRGEADVLKADLSGASVIKAFYFPVDEANLVFSGASDGQVTVTNSLQVVATGGSHVVYRGQPSLTSEVSGSSSVHQE